MRQIDVPRPPRRQVLLAETPTPVRRITGLETAIFSELLIEQIRDHLLDARGIFGLAMLGFALVEAIALFALVIALVIGLVAGVLYIVLESRLSTRHRRGQR